MLFILPASAAEVTTLPDPLGGSLAVQYRGRVELGRLIEGTEPISKRQVEEHNVDISLAFAPIAGAALTVQFDISPHWKWSYPEARTMLLEPVSGGGSYLADTVDEDTETVSLKGSGLAGVWIGGAFTPFSERFFPKQKVSWRFDVALRPGSKKSNRWTVANGKRGASMGGTAVRVAGAFSRRGGVAEPYIRSEYVHEGKVVVDLVDEAGPRDPEFTVNPGSTVEVIGGTGVLATDDTDNESYFDVHIGGIYKSWEDLPAGMLLPNVIDSAKSISSTHSESLTGVFGIGANLVFSPNLRSNFGGRFTYTVPHRQEHLFDVTTSTDTFGVEWHLSITGSLSKADFNR